MPIIQVNRVKEDGSQEIIGILIAETLEEWEDEFIRMKAPIHDWVTEYRIQAISQREYERIDYSPDVWLVATQREYIDARGRVEPCRVSRAEQPVQE